MIKNVNKLIFSVAPFMCIKPPTEDQFISQIIHAEGVFERSIVTNAIRAAKLYPDAVFLDLGANLGMFRFLLLLVFLFYSW